MIARADAVLREVQPDAVLILGDTNSCLAAIAAKRLRIPVFHMEAGNRCFDERVPEEINRRIVDHIADINLPYSDISRGYLLAEGLPADRIIKTGSPMYEVLHHYLPKIEASDVLERLGLDAGPLLLGELPSGRERRFGRLFPHLSRCCAPFQQNTACRWWSPRTRARGSASRRRGSIWVRRCGCSSRWHSPITCSWNSRAGHPLRLRAPSPRSRPSSTSRRSTSGRPTSARRAWRRGR